MASHRDPTAQTEYPLCASTDGYRNRCRRKLDELPRPSGQGPLRVPRSITQPDDCSAHESPGDTTHCRWLTSTVSTRWEWIAFDQCGRASRMLCVTCSGNSHAPHRSSCPHPAGISRTFASKEVNTTNARVVSSLLRTVAGT